MLSFSPDCDARLCYLVVLLLGVGSAWFQVLGRLAGLKSKAIFAWSQLWTWLVFSIYLVIPLVLFWLLDRTGALNDTSLFAAILVGLAYPAVVAGTTGIKPGEGVSSVMGWLNQAADTLTTKATAYVAVEDQLFMRPVIAEMVKTPARHKEVEDCALIYSASPSALRTALAAAGAAADKAEIAYGEATSSAHGLKPVSELVKAWKLPGVVSPYDKAYRWCFSYAGVVMVVSVIALVVVFSGVGEAPFLVWRLTKPGVSAADLHRNTEALKQRLDPASPNVKSLYSRLSAAVLRPGLELPRADRILSLLLLYRGRCSDPEFRAACDLLVGGIRAGSVDVRARTHHTLLLLAEECGPIETNTPRGIQLKELQDWQPLATESPIDLERKWRAWRTWWSSDGGQAH